MDSLKNISKGGWHPGGAKGGNSSSSYGGSSSGGGSSFKGIDQVKGWMGKGGGKQDVHERAANHTSTPLNQLKDPASFGPPPKRTGTFSSETGSVSSPTAPKTVYEGSRLTATTGGLGAPLSRAQVEEDKRYAQEREEAQHRAEEEPQAPVGPFRTDTTGLSTTGFAPPPKFRGAGAGASPSPPNVGPRAVGPAPGRTGPPTLPPRLPPRQVAASPPPPPAYEQAVAPERGVLNQGALGRLGAAGVQVPGLDIGNRSANATSPPPPPQSPSHLSELQSRFSRLNTSQNQTQTSADTTTTTNPPPPAAAAGTTWAQKQAALRTASQFHKDPSSVSLTDARSAASTANSFRERHGEQVASGWKAASGLDKKYGISDRFGSGSGQGQGQAQTQGQQESGVIDAAGVAKKKAPPPPPPVKKPGLGGAGGGSGGGGAPPINWGSRPGLP